MASDSRSLLKVIVQQSPDSNTQLAAHDEEGGGFSIKGAAASGDGRKHAEQDACTICLQAISERAVAVPCKHSAFDFPCLFSWLQERATCPLCKAGVKEVQYDWRSAQDFKTYSVPAPKAKAGGPAPTRSGYGRRDVERWTPADAALNREDPSLTRRRHVYRDGLYSLHVGSTPFSGYTDVSASAFSASAVLQSRARAFLRRELKVFNYLDDPDISRGRSRDYFIEYVVFVRRFHEPRGAHGRAEELVAEFLGLKNAKLFLHELEAWLRSPFATLAEWDEAVQYKDINGSRTAKGDGLS